MFNLRPSNVRVYRKKNFNRKIYNIPFPMSLIKTNKITIKSSSYQKEIFAQILKKVY